MIRILVMICLVLSNAYAIRNGVKASKYTTAHVVHISFKGHHCTGVRLSHHYILTAAHCFRRSSKRFTVQYLRSDNVLISKKVYLSNVTIKSTKLSDELAVIDIKNIDEEPDAEFLPIANYHRALYTPGVRFEIAGYGITHHSEVAGTLHTGELEFYSNYKPSSYPSTMLRLRATDKNQMPCPGDSGGPLYITYENGEKELVGIISFITNSERSILNLRALTQCQEANEAFYIPLGLHLDFLEPYL